MPGTSEISGSGVAEGGREGATVSWVVSQNAGALTLDGTRCYRVGRSDVVLIDPGPALENQIERLRSLVGAARVRAVCLTHAHLDHSGAAAAAARAFEAPVAGSPATLARCGLRGRELHAGEAIEMDRGKLGLKVLETPGHSPDHLAYLLLPERALFSGDLILGTGSSAVLHPEGNVSACLRSFEHLLRFAPFTLYPGHGPPVWDGAARVREYRRHRLDRHAEIERAVRAGNLSVPSLRLAVYGRLPESLVGAAEASVRAHLARMREMEEDIPPIAGFDDTDSPPEEP
jgi:glyoxylase-like metal-dependent hydrolase (beta-lactamase superfamily II)